MKPHTTVLAWWHFGIALTRLCGRLTVAPFLALWLGCKVTTVEQRLYEWCIDTAHKARTRRQTLDVTTCFVPMLRWIISLWQGSHLALALDATTLSDRLVVVSISVVQCGMGLSVAWTILVAGRPQAWWREWLLMLRIVRPAISGDWVVIVLADRGDARWRYRPIVRLGWYPFLRINTGATCRPTGQFHWYWLRELLPLDRTQ